MKITLIGNALDFILSALEYAQTNESRNLKYAALHLSDGVELLLKERLRREHWSLLFADVNKANQNAFKTGEFKSVDFDDCIKRLESISAVDMGNHIGVLRILRCIRNRLQHFEYTGREDEVISITVKTWSFVLDFLTYHLSDVMIDHVTTIDNIKRLMIKHEEFVKDRLTCIQPAVDRFRKQSDAVLQCPFCLQEAFLIPGNKEYPHCLFCRFSAPPEEAVDNWCFEFFGFQSPKEQVTNPVKFTCPECGSETLIRQEFMGMNPPMPGWVCFNCGQTWDIDEIDFCITCGNPYTVSEDDFGMCSDCVRMQMEHG